jgi:hypothetical protein
MAHINARLDAQSADAVVDVIVAVAAPANPVFRCAMRSSTPLAITTL